MNGKTDDGFVSIRADLDYGEFLQTMFERIDENGLVYIPGQQSPERDDRDKTYRLRIIPEKFDPQKMHGEITALIAGIEREARYGLNGLIYEKYIKPFDAAGFNAEKIAAISEKVNITQNNRRLTGAISRGKMLSQKAADYLKQNIGVTLSVEEYELYGAYIQNLCAQSEKRLGAKGRFALMLIYKTQQYYAMLKNGAEEKSLRETRRNIAADYVIAFAAADLKAISNTLINRYEKIMRWSELEDEDSLDEYFKLKKTNSSKSLAPLLVYFIIRDFTDSVFHLRQQDILDLLELRYGLTLERKALGRIVHALEDMRLNIYTDRANGIWMEYCGEC